MSIFRLLFVGILTLIGVIGSFHGPFNTLLFYLWIAYFRPDYWVENNILLSIRISLVVGISLLLSVLISGVKLRFTPFTGLLSLVLVHVFISSLLSDYSPSVVDFLKTLVVSYLITMLIKSEKDLKIVLIVIVLSLGFFDGAKQGWQFLILHPGSKNFNELPSLGDNNFVAVAMLMLVPVFIALSQTAERKIIKYTYIFLVIGVIYRALSTYSRGGFLTLLVICVIYWLRSRKKVRSLLIAVLLATLILPTFPQSFWDRMNTLTDSKEEQDASVQGRLYFWGIAWELAKKNPVFGVGHNCFGQAYLNFDTSHTSERSVHSAWFAVLSERGFIGLILFVTIYLYCLSSCARVRKKCRGRPELKSILIYSNSIEMSLIAAAVGITFLSFHNQEILWHYFALATVPNQILKDIDASEAGQSVNVINDVSNPISAI